MLQSLALMSLSILFYYLLTVLVNTLYPHNPDAIHSKLQKVFDRLVDMKDGERRIMTAMFHTIAQKHPEVTPSQKKPKIHRLLLN